MLANLRAQLEGQVAEIFVYDNGYPDEGRPPDVIPAHGWPLHRMWNDGLDMAALETDGPYNVIVINDDVEVEPDFVARLDAALRLDPDHWIAYPNWAGLAIGHGDCARTTSDEMAGQTMSGWALMLRGEAGLRYDEHFAWWYGDSDLERRVRQEGKHVVAVGGCFARHLDPVKSTFANRDRLEQAMWDEAHYAKKWALDPSTLWLAVNRDRLPVLAAASA